MAPNSPVIKHVKCRNYLAVIVVSAVVSSTCIARSAEAEGINPGESDRPPVVIGGGNRLGSRVIEEIVKADRKSERSLDADYVLRLWGDAQNIERFCSGKCDLLFHRAFPTNRETSLLASRFTTEKPVEAFVIGFAQAIVIVHPENSVRQLSLEAIHNLLRAESGNTRWTTLGGSSGFVKCYGEGRHEFSTSNLVIRHTCMMLGPAYPTGYKAYRKDYKECTDGFEVIKEVRKDRNAIGFLSYNGQPLKDVKVLAIAKDAASKPIEYRAGKFLGEVYPLTEPLVLYLRPDAPHEAKKICEFAVSAEAEPIITDLGLWPNLLVEKQKSEQRLADAKARKGAGVDVVGTVRGTELVRILAPKFIAANETVQLTYQKQPTPASATRRYLNSSAEILIVEESPSATLATKLDAGHKQILLGKAALGVIVHPQTNVASLSVDELRQICRGGLKNWPAATDQGPAVHGYALPFTEPVMQISRQQLLPDKTAANLKFAQQPDTAKLIQAVSKDPGGIGFIDLSQLSKDTKSVQVIGIVLSDSRTSMPSYGQIPNDYPLVQPWTLYVSPHASDTAKKFADWLEANPFPEILAQHRLFPPKAIIPVVTTEKSNPVTQTAPGPRSKTKK